MNFEDKYDRPPTATLRANTLLAAVSRLGGGSPVQTRKLGGGFMNANYLAKLANGERLVLRFSRDGDRLQMEADLLHYLSIRVPEIPVPVVLWRSQEPLPGGYSAFAMTYVAGNLASQVEDTLSGAERRDLCEQIAVAAARLHAMGFAENGFLGPGPSVGTPFASYSAGTVGFLQNCFGNERFRKRVGTSRLARFERCVAIRSDLYHPSRRGQLCHGDFNQKNMIVRRTRAGHYTLAAVLDWEFALSASGVVDIGNLLRFEHLSPMLERTWFVDAYLGAGGQLDDCWREQSLFADLLAQCLFLISDKELPNTFATALEVIDRSLDTLGPPA